MALVALPMPLHDPIARPRDSKIRPGARDPFEGNITDSWIKWFTELSTDVSTAPLRLGDTVSLTAQGASIGATSLDIGTAAAGLYRVTYSAQITRAGSVSSSLTVTLAWTRGGVAQSYSGSAITGNTTATHQSGTQLIKIDAATPVTYATTYADGGGATSMQYALDVVIERVEV